MKKYIFNTTILTNNNFVSAIGHESTAQIISSVLGLNVPMNRINASFEEVGDLAICFKLNSRPKEGSILSLEDLQEIGFSWKLLERIE